MYNRNHTIQGRFIMTIIQIGSHSYTAAALENKLSLAKPIFNNWGTRKIQLELGEEYKYDEILNAVLKAVRDEQPSEVTAIDNIYKNLERLQNKGHEKSGVIYTIFRRMIPNLFRDYKLQNLKTEIESLKNKPQLLEIVEDESEFKQHVNEYLSTVQQKLKDTDISQALLPDTKIDSH